VTFGSGSFLWLTFHNARGELGRHDGFVIVAAFWLVLSAMSAIPFILGPHLDFVDAFFEAASAFTTTGATVLVGLDSLPRSVLFYRQELRWHGNYRTGRGHPATAGHGRDAVISSGNTRPVQG
jgi:trk system potassium uptake protein TrkH